MKFLKSLVAVAVIACAGVQASAQSALNEILSEGVLKVGATGDWNPMTMRDVATNSYTGYDIDVMTALAADLGVEVEFVPTDWKTLVSGVTSGQYHITGSASVSPSRAKALRRLSSDTDCASAQALRVSSGSERGSDLSLGRWSKST